MKKICVLGLGYIGLPTAAMFATHGYQVVGVDVNPRVVNTLNNGDVHIEEPGLKTIVRAALRSESLMVQAQPAPSDVFIIAVPTPFLRQERNQGGSQSTQVKHADLSYVRSATESIVRYLRPGNLVVLESTSPPRTTEQTVVPILEQSGLRVGQDLYAAHCPERVLPGRILEELVSNDRIIGGIDVPSAEMAKSLYASFVDGKIFLTDATTAEMAKLMENTYRDVNIALANEFALVAEQVGINVWEAIALANRHPRVNILKPGPGVGGHCIAVDPWFIAEAAPEVTPLIQAARRVNDARPAHVVRQVKQATAGIPHPVIACLGLAYKADVDDIRESPAVEVVRELQAEGFEVRAYDPYVPVLLEPGQVGSLEAALDGAHCVVVLTDHTQFRKLGAEYLTRAGRVMIDTRNALARNGLQPA